jgi:cytochrome c-type biogenesis protein CcmE
MLTVIAVVVIMAAAAAGILSSFRQQLIFFYTPTDLHEAMGKDFDDAREIRVGGLVKEGSVYHTQGGKMGFVITDLSHEIHASYTGMVPALFREGQGVVAQGHISSIGELEASSILAKHDENYMPREVVDALKKSGRWKQ